MTRSASVSVTVSAGAVAGITLSVSKPTGTIPLAEVLSGRVTDAKGTPVPSQTLTLVVNGVAQTPTVMTASDGTYSFNTTFTAAGSYICQVQAPNGVSSPQLTVTANLPPPAKLTIASSTAIASAGVPFTLTLTVLDSAGNPLPGITGAMVSFTDSLVPIITLVPQAFPATNAQGQTSVQITAPLPATLSCSVTLGQLKAQVTVNVAGVITITATPTTGVHPLIVTISGTFLTQGSVPCPGYTLSLYINGSFFTTVITDANGRFTQSLSFANAGTFNLSYKLISNSNTVSIRVT